MRVVCTQSVVGNPTLERKVVSKSNTPVPFARGVFFRGANSLKTLEVLPSFFVANAPARKRKRKGKQKVKQEQIRGRFVISCGGA
jgi:hypothetical protein